jgi:hypothetical protein
MAAIATLHHGRGSLPVIGSDPMLSMRLIDLAEQSQRLRMEFLRNGIEFSLTVARFPEAKPDSQHLRESCRRAAGKVYGQIRTLITKPAFARMDLSEFVPKLDELEAMLKEWDAGTDQHITMRPVPKTSPGPERPGSPLTPRETQVLRLITQGCSTKEVSHQLKMSFKTAACHDVVTLTHYAVRTGLLKL